MPPKPPKPSKVHSSEFLRRLRNITIHPIINRFFYESKLDLHLTIPHIIYVNEFTNDAGNSTPSFPCLSQNGYVNLYINGVLQAGNAYSIKKDKLIIQDIGGTIYEGTPIIIEMVKYCIFYK